MSPLSGSMLPEGYNMTQRPKLLVGALECPFKSLRTGLVFSLCLLGPHIRRISVSQVVSPVSPSKVCPTTVS